MTLAQWQEMTCFVDVLTTDACKARTLALPSIVVTLVMFGLVVNELAGGFESRARKGSK